MATNFQDIVNASSAGGAIDPQVFATATQYANNAATNAYNNAKLNLETEQQAFAKAQQAYANAMQIATTFGTSPGGTYNGMQLPAAGTPTMGQMAQWAQLYGTAAAPANQYQQTLSAQAQQFQQQQTAQNNYAALSGYYTPQGPGDVLGTVGGGVNLGQIDQALQNALGRDYNQNVFQAMTSSLQGQDLTSPQAMQAINSAIQSASQGRLTYANIAGALPGGGYNQAPAQAQTLAAQKQQADLTGMTNYQPYSAGTWLYDPQTGTYGQVSANGQVRNFTDINQARAAGMPVANYNQNAPDPARVVTTSSAGGWGGIGQQGYTTAYQQQLFNQAMDTAKFQQSTAQSYLDLLSRLQGPADYGQYLKVLGSTPQGIQGLTAAAAGAYVPGAGATTGQQPTAQTLPNFVNSATSGYAQGGVSPYQAAAQAGSGNAGTGQNQTNGAQVTAAQAPNSAPMGQASGTTYDQFMAAAQNLPAPNQLSPQAMNAMTDSQKQILQSMYGQLGYSTADINSLFSQSLPKYAAGQGVATGSFRLQ